MVVVFYLWRRGKPIWFVVLPMSLMVIMPAWAMTYQIVHDFLPNEKWHLLAFGVVIMGLQAWTVVEAILIWPRAKGVLEDSLPPLPLSKPAGGVNG